MITPETRIIVIGASMGGIDFFTKLVSQFTPDQPLAVFLVQHVFSEHKSLLPRILAQHTNLTVKQAEDGEEIRPGHLYVTPVDRHLMIYPGYIKTTEGPFENGSRPSINTLFRSAAVAYQHQVIGILLTGLLTDGTKGLQAIKACGGITIAQDPQEAPFPEMPLNAIKHETVDYIAKVEEIGGLVRVLLNKVPYAHRSVPKELKKQVQIAEGRKESTSEQDQTRLNENEQHQYKISVEASLWSILQFMQEKTNLLENLAEAERSKGREKIAQRFARKAEESRVHTENMRQHVLSVSSSANVWE